MQNGISNNHHREFLTPKEAAAYIGVSIITFYSWMKKPSKKGGPPVRRFGKNCYRLPRDKFIEWANGNTE